MSKDIYCEGGEGSILYAVQMSNICNDSKTFVDMKMKFDPEIVISNWEKFCKTSKGFAKDEVKDFVDKNFDVESEELEKWSPEDWSESPAFNVINLEAKTFCEGRHKKNYYSVKFVNRHGYHDIKQKSNIYTNNIPYVSLFLRMLFSH